MKRASRDFAQARPSPYRLQATTTHSIQRGAHKRGLEQERDRRNGAPAPGPIGALDFARTDPRAWRPHDLTAADAYAQLLMATLRLATARQEERLSPALRFAGQHDTRIEQARGLIMQRERLDQAAAVELLRLQAQIEGQPIRAVAEALLARPRP